MTVLLALSETPDEQGYVDYLINVDRGTFIRLDGINTDECIGILHGFLCKYDVCGRKDRLMHEVHPLSTQVQLRERYTDLSFVGNFYRLAWRSQQRYLEITSAVSAPPHHPTPELLQATRTGLRVVNPEFSELMHHSRLNNVIAEIIDSVMIEEDEDTDYYVGVSGTVFLSAGGAFGGPDEIDLDRNDRVTELLSDASRSGHLTEEMSGPEDSLSGTDSEPDVQEASENLSESCEIYEASEEISQVELHVDDDDERSADDLNQFSERSGSISSKSDHSRSSVEKVSPKAPASSKRSPSKKKAIPVPVVQEDEDEEEVEVTLEEESSSELDQLEESSSEEPLPPKKTVRKSTKKVTPAKKAAPAPKKPVKKVAPVAKKPTKKESPVKKTARTSKY